MKIVTLLACFVVLVGIGMVCGLEKLQKGVLKGESKDVVGNVSSQKATFAGGCFWCMEAPFEKMEGVVSVVAGYIGGHKKEPSYKEVCSGETGHYEAVEVYFDPKKVTYTDLVLKYWKLFDPTDAGGSFFDRGQQYSSAIFYHSEFQKEIAETSKVLLESSSVFKKPIATKIIKASIFYKAEEYHQDYYKKRSSHYATYRLGSGRDVFIKKYWGDEKHQFYLKPRDSELKKKLSAIEYSVTQKEGTERSFSNQYWNHKEEGLYVDKISSEPLFASVHKYDSKTGWPSFYQALVPENIIIKTDTKLGYPRFEVRSKSGKSHLGHLFDDGPKPSGKRYCINSAALHFVPKEHLSKKGLARFLYLFK